MGVLATRVQRLRTLLQSQLNGSPASAADVAHMRDLIADAVLRALNDEQHPLTADLAALKERVELEKDGKLYRDLMHSSQTPATDATDRLEQSSKGRAQRKATKLDQLHCEAPKEPRKRLDPNRHLFMAQPGMFSPEHRRYWRLQLLLQTAVSSHHADRVAQLLSLSIATMNHAAAEAARFSTKDWSNLQYADYLLTAIEQLDYPDAPLKLDGRQLRFSGGMTIRLSRKEEAMMRMLIADARTPVTYKAFQEAGIKAPQNTKLQLMRKAAKAGLTLSIASLPQAYVLVEAAETAAES